MITIILVVIALIILAAAAHALLPIAQPWKNLVVFLIIVIAVVYVLHAAGVA